MIMLSDWEREGFACAPQEYEAKGTEIIYRCYSTNPGRPVRSPGADTILEEGSRLYGNCFFVPGSRTGGQIYNDVASFRFEKEWTWEYLEQQLNAWFWGNDFERVAVFRINPGIRYRIGPVGQSTRAAPRTLIKDPAGFDRYEVTVQRHLSWPRTHSELKQVLLCVNGDELSLRNALTKQLPDWLVRRGNVARGSTHNN